MSEEKTVNVRFTVRDCDLAPYQLINAVMRGLQEQGIDVAMVEE